MNRFTLCLFVLLCLLSSQAPADTFTWQGDLDREWGSLTFGGFPPVVNTNWSPSGIPEAGDTARFDGSGAGSVFVGGPTGTVRAVDRLEFAGPASYELARHDFFGGQLILGGGGLHSDGRASHLISTGVILDADQTWRVLHSAPLSIDGPIAGGGRTLTKTGSGVLELTPEPGSTLGQLVSAEGDTRIVGGNLTLEHDTFRPGALSVTRGETVIEGGASVHAVGLQYGGISVDNDDYLHTELRISGSETSLTADGRFTVGVDGLGTAVVENGAQATVGGSIVLGDFFDSLGVLRIQDAGRVTTPETYVGLESGARGRLTLGGGGARLVTERLRIGGFDEFGGAGEVFIGSGGVIETGWAELNSMDSEIVVAGGQLVAGLLTHRSDRNRPLQLADPGDGRSALVVGSSDASWFWGLPITDFAGQAGGIEKVGEGTFILAGVNSFTGSLIVSEGGVEFRDTALLGAGDPIRVASGARLTSAINLPRPIDADGEVIARASILLGDATRTDGFRAGSIDAAGHDLVLLDRDMAELTSGDTLLAGGSLGTVHGLRIGAEARIAGFGEIAGPVTNDGAIDGTDPDNPITLGGIVGGGGDFLGHLVFTGLFEPGESPATVTMGSPTFAGSNTLRLELGGVEDGLFDRLAIGGEATLGGALDVLAIDGYTPTPGDAFELLVTDGAGRLTGAFDRVYLPTLRDGLDWRTDSTSTGLTLTVVPEPGTVVLVVGGLALLWRGRRGHGGL
jgi:autotransporter-associated beta strand protein